MWPSSRHGERDRTPEPHFGLKIAVAPAAEPLDLTTVKLHLRIDTPNEDELLTLLIAAARNQAEVFLQRRLITQTWDLTLDRFPGYSTGAQGWGLNAMGLFSASTSILVPYPELQSVTSLAYIDQAGTSQTWASSNYIVDTATSRIAPAYGTSWPVSQYRINAVTIRYVSGYGTTAASVPGDIRAGMLLHIGTLYEHREDVAITERGESLTLLPRGAEQLMWPYRVLG